MLPTSIPSASGIYRIVCNVTGKLYIGSAIDLKTRHIQHFSQLRRNRHGNPYLQHAWNKYGEAFFTFEVLELVLPMSLLMREQHWMNYYKPFGENGFNIARKAGSWYGIPHSPETKEKIRQAHLGKKKSPEHVENMRRANLGKKQSEESIRKTREANTGRKCSPEAREKIARANRGHAVSQHSRAALDAYNAAHMKTLILISPDGVEHVVTGLGPFYKEHGLKAAGIRSILIGRCTHHHGWKVRYPEQGIS